MFEMIFKKKLYATFGSDYAIERAEEKLTKEGFKYERIPPIRLVIYVDKKSDIERVRKIISESLGYLEPIEGLRSKITSKILATIYAVLNRGKKKK